MNTLTVLLALIHPLSHLFSILQTGRQIILRKNKMYSEKIRKLKIKKPIMYSYSSLACVTMDF